MKKRSILAAGIVALAASIGVGAVIDASTVGTGDVPVATHSQHSTKGPEGLQSSALPDSTTAPAATPAAPAPTASVAESADETASVARPVERPEPGGLAGAPGKEVQVAPLPDVDSVRAQPGKGKPQSLSKALEQPHGVAAAGVSPRGEGVNDGTTKQATGLKTRTLERGEQDAGVNDAARTGGCAPGYGDGRSCLPVAPPSAAEHAGHNMKVVWTCEELLTLFPEGIPLQVRGTDPLGLDEDGNGIACG